MTSTDPPLDAPAGTWMHAADHAPPLPRAVLWDMDGTLVDTEPYWFAAERDLVDKFGHGDWPNELAQGMVGFDLLDGAAYLQRHGGVDLPAEEIVDRLLDGVIARLHRHIPWRAGARELLAELNEAGVPCALVTMSWRRFVDPVLAALPNGTFTAVVTGDEIPPGEGKPSPTPYMLGAEGCGADPAECVAIEDSPTGVASALAAGCVVLGVPNAAEPAPAPGMTLVDSLDGIRFSDLADLYEHHRYEVDTQRGAASGDGRGRTFGIDRNVLIALLVATAIGLGLWWWSARGDEGTAVDGPPPSTSTAAVSPWITFPEGLTIAQMAERLAGERPDLDPDAFLAAAAAGTPPAEIQVPPGTATLEGLLFPNTYQASGPGDEAAIVEQMLGLMGRVAREEDLAGGANALDLSAYEVMIVASMIEKEAGTDSDRPLIARVIYNRLALGMPLQIDATLYYGAPPGTPFSELRERDSPFNTYEHAGLPPTPISNPGRASINAALHPAANPDPTDELCVGLPAEECRYLFYVLAGEDGSHKFAATYEQHLENVDAARAAGLF